MFQQPHPLPNQESKILPSLSILVPARNESGNIPALFRKLPALVTALPKIKIELLFIEGNSTDDTWRVIQKFIKRQLNDVFVRAIQQPGRGKADAMRHGYSQAKNDLIIILDADLTVDVSYIPEFYNAYIKQRGEFIIGDRLSLPSEPGAMRPLNRLGNIAFAKLLSWIIKVPINDTLCGTKLFARKDWQDWQSWKEKTLGNKDPFGDFELIFPATLNKLKFHSIPVKYKARQYGDTNIHRWRDGLKLLQLTWLGWRHVRLQPRK